MNNKRLIDISTSIEAIKLIEESRAPKTTLDLIIIPLFFLYIKIFRGFLWLFQFVLLGLKAPQKKDVNQIKVVVIYLHGMLGDVAVHIPAINVIKKLLTNVKMICICNSEGFPISEFLNSSGIFDQCIVIGSEPVVRHGFTLKIDDDRLKKISTDLFINFSPFSNRGNVNFIIKEMIFAKKIGSKFYVGDALNFCNFGGLHNRMRRFFIKNEPRRGSSILNSLGMNAVSLPDEFPKFGQIPNDLLDNDPNGTIKPYAILNPGAKFEVKRWPAISYGTIAKYLHERYGLQVYVTGSIGEMSLGEEVVSCSENTAISLCGKTSIPELIEILRCAVMTITNDTGPMHLSSLMNRPTIAIFDTRMSLIHWYPTGINTTILAYYHQHSFSFDDVGVVPHGLDKISTKVVKDQIDKLICVS